MILTNAMEIIKVKNNTFGVRTVFKKLHDEFDAEPGKTIKYK